MTTKKTKSPTTDAEQAKDLLLWARRQRIVVNEVHVGTVHLVVADLALATTVTPPKSEEAASRSLYARYGGDMLAEVTKEDDDHATYVDEDDEVHEDA